MNAALRYLLAALFLSIFSGARGQDETKLAYGICGGVNQANFQVVSGSLLFPTASMNAPQFGLFIEGLRQNRLNLRMEINYRRKSDVLSIYNPGMAYPMRWDGLYDLDYLSVLILPELRFGGRVEWLLNGGIYVGGLLNASLYRLQPDGLSFSRSPENSRSHFPAADGGFVLGTGLCFHINEKWQLGLQARWMRTMPGSDAQSADYGAMISISHSLNILPDSKTRKVLNYLEH